VQRGARSGVPFGQVVDAAQPQRAAVVFDAHAAVLEHLHAVALQERAPQPDVGTEEVVVVAGHGEHAERGRRCAERFEQQDLAFARVDQVAAEQHQVGLGGHHPVEQRAQVVGGAEAAGVHVADEREAQAVERFAPGRSGSSSSAVRAANARAAAASAAAAADRARG
jgi:hypothetical protein